MPEVHPGPTRSLCGVRGPLWGILGDIPAPAKRTRRFCCLGLFDVFPGSCRRIISTMSLKRAAFFALIGMVLLTVLLAVGFIRDVSALLAGAIAAVVLLTSLIHLLASLSLALFLYVFHKGQG